MNVDTAVVEGFDDEWSRFDYSDASPEELRRWFESYFAVFPWNTLPASAQGFDLGCGTGRWGRFVARRVGHLHLIDPAPRALESARRNLAQATNVTFHVADAESIPLPDGSMDFGYSLGVLHHVPDTRAALSAAVKKLKPGAPFLLYLYYAFDNRPLWFRAVWRASEIIRRAVSGLPKTARYGASQAIAALVYWPLARSARLLESLGANVSSMPLSVYRRSSFYVMRTDALDRFGTTLEQRFTRAEIEEMMKAAGLESIEFHNGTPYWCALGYRRGE